MKVSIRYSRSCLWVNPGMTDVTVMKKIFFKMDGTEYYVPSGFHSDCASTPMWWIAAALVLSIVGLEVVSAFYFIPFQFGYTLTLVALLLTVLWLRKSNLLPVGIIHDCMYAGETWIKETGGSHRAPYISRKRADEWMRTAMVEYTMPATWKPFRHLAAFLAWAAVRMFGAGRYRKRREEGQ